MKNLYRIKETCPMWNDGTGIPYERYLPYVSEHRELIDEYVKDLEIVSAERVLCLEYEIVQDVQLIETYTDSNSNGSDRDEMLTDIERETLYNIYNGDCE